ncbi:MAG: hypothetical protein AB7O52_18190 [Planctomycetota bacterium]
MKSLALWIPFWVGTALGLCTIPGDFVFDDITIVENNPRLEPLTAIPRLFVDNYWGDFAQGGIYRPLTLATFAVERALWGNGSAAGYHVTNALLYGGCAAALAYLAMALGWGARLAAGVGVLFALHPIHVEAVAPLVGRSELGAGLLVLLAIAIEARDDSRRGAWRPALWTGVTIAGALFFKETGVAAVPVLLLLPFVRATLASMRPGVRSSWREWWQQGVSRLAGRWRTGVAVGVALGVWASLRAVALDQPPDPVGVLNNVLSERGTIARWAGALAVSLNYHAKVLWPWPLCADYSFAALDPTTSLTSPTSLLGLATWLALAATIIWGLRTAPRISLALGLYVAALLPVSNLLIPIGTIFGERLLFLPSAGALLALGAAYAYGSVRSARGTRIATGVVVAAGLLGLVGFLVRVADWRSELTITEAMVRVQPMSAKAHGKFGWELYRDAQDQPDSAARAAQEDRAQHHLERSLEIYPDFTDSYINLSIVLAQRGHSERALAAARKARSLEPGKIGSYAQIAQVSWKLQKKADALEACEAGLRLAPDHLPLLEVRAHLRFDANEPALAAADFAKAFALEPKVEWKLMEIRSLVAARDFTALERVLDAAVTDAAQPRSPLRPERHTLLNNRGMVYAHRNAHELAIQDFTRALELIPTFAAPRGNRLKSLLALGRDDEARADLEVLEQQLGVDNVKPLRALFAPR